jgi:hypothetical protein
VGVKKRAITPKVSKTTALENTLLLHDASDGYSFAVFKDGPGRPTLNRQRLFHLRESLTCLIEPLWWSIGLALLSAKTLEDVRQAFAAIGVHTNCEQLPPLVRETFEQSTAKHIAQTRQSLIPALERFRAVHDEFQKVLRTDQDWKQLSGTLSTKYQEQLEEDLGLRRENTTRILKHRKRLTEAMRKLEKRALIARGRAQRRLNDRLRLLQKEQEQLDRDFVADSEVCKTLEDQIRSITPERRSNVEKVLLRLREESTRLENELKEIDAEVKHLQNKLQNQESYYFRTQVLTFLDDGDYGFTPRNLAAAIAGLPYVTSRRSAELCTKLGKSKLPKARDYCVFLFIESTWNSRSHRRVPLLKELKERIKLMPKFYIVDGKRRNNHFRTFLAEKWYYLKGAVEDYERQKFTARGAPYRITGAFLTSQTNLSSPEDLKLAEENMILD